MDQLRSQNFQLKKQNAKLKEWNLAVVKQVNRLKIELIDLKQSYSQLHHAFMDLKQKNLSQKQYDLLVNRFDQVMKISDCQMVSFMDPTIKQSSNYSVYSNQNSMITCNGISLQKQSKSNQIPIQNKSQCSFSIKESELLRNLNFLSPIISNGNISEVQYSKNRSEQKKFIEEGLKHQNQQESKQVSYNQLVNLVSKKQSYSGSVQKIQDQSQFSLKQKTQLLVEKSLEYQINPQYLDKMKKQFKQLYPHMQNDQSVNLQEELKLIHNSSKNYKSQLHLQSFIKQNFSESVYFQPDQSEPSTMHSADNEDLDEVLDKWVQQSQRLIIQQQHQKQKHQYKIWKKIQSYKFVQRIQLNSYQRFIINFPAYLITQQFGSGSIEHFIKKIEDFIKNFDFIKEVNFDEIIIDDKLNHLPSQLLSQFFALSWTFITKLTVIIKSNKKIGFGQLFQSMKSSLEEINFTFSVFNEQFLQEIVSLNFLKLKKVHIKLLHLTGKAYEILQGIQILPQTELQIFIITGNQLLPLGSSKINQKTFTFSKDTNLDSKILKEQALAKKNKFIEKYHQYLKYKNDTKTKWPRIQFIDPCNRQVFEQFLDLNWQQVRKLYIGYLKFDQALWLKFVNNSSSYCNLQILTLHIQTLKLIFKTQIRKTFPLMSQIDIVYSFEEEFDQEGLQKLLYLAGEFKQINKEIKVQVFSCIFIF